MISVAEADNIIRSHAIDPGIETVELEHCLNKVLAENINADRDFPPYDRVTMDGIAINYEEFKKGNRDFSIEGLHTAGSPKTLMEDPGNCLEVMTGAILPEKTDTVVRYEDIRISNGQARILVNEIAPGQNIHRQGNDRRKGDLLITAGTIITPAEIGVLATVGKVSVQVRRKPSVVIISTGDELTDVSEKPEPHQIRKSNTLSIRAALKEFGINAAMEHISDELEETTNRISALLEEFDIIILSGGVSKGKADHVPTALERCGVKKLFHRIKQRPGKPFWFGIKDKKVVFAFPGNPVSTFLCYHRYFLPWIKISLGIRSERNFFAALSEDFIFKPELTYFLQVRIFSDSETGKLMAQPVEGKGSGDLANLLESQAFVELPSDVKRFRKGQAYRLIMFK